MVYGRSFPQKCRMILIINKKTLKIYPLVPSKLWHGGVFSLSHIWNMVICCQPNKKLSFIDLGNINDPFISSNFLGLHRYSLSLLINKELHSPDHIFTTTPFSVYQYVHIYSSLSSGFSVFYM